MKYYDVCQCDADPSIYAVYNTFNHEKILAESPFKARQIYRTIHGDSCFIRASFICNK